MRRYLLGVLLVAAAALLLVDRTVFAAVAVVATIIAVVAARRRRRWRQLRRDYLTPTVTALRVAAGGADVKLSVNAAMRAAIPRQVRPPGRVGAAVRSWWASQRPVQAAHRARQHGARMVAPVADALAQHRAAPRIVAVIDTPYLGEDARRWIHAVVRAKLAPDLTVHWQLRGPQVVATWTPRTRPPRTVSADRIEAVLSTLPESKVYLGETGKGPLTVDIDTDSPHVGLSSGAGGGKSTLAACMATQILARGGRVVVIDPKSSSHRWAYDHPAVRYATTPRAIHDALLALADEVDERNRHPDADHQRLLVVVEETNSATVRLRGWWDDHRPKGGPKVSPAIRALEMIAHQGRAVRVHLLACAQQLTARSLGNAETRENFGIRALARFSAGSWKMLAPHVAMPAPSRIPGRWHVVVADQVHEVQVPKLDNRTARRIAGMSPVSPPLDVPPVTCDVPGDTTPTGDRLTLTQAVAEGVVPLRREAIKKRLQRDPDAPQPVDWDDQAAVYRREDLERFAASLTAG